MTQFRASIVVPVRNEAENISKFFDQLIESVQLSLEVIVVVDDSSDPTLPIIKKYVDEKKFRNEIEIRSLISNYPPGPANAIRYGIDNSNGPVVVVTMSDGSDDPRIIDSLVKLVERGCVIAAASRYMPGGQQIGGPRLKKLLAKNASRILRILAGVATHDSTNSFKAYSVPFIKDVEIESDEGFEVGLELVAKAHRRRLLIGEVPTIWIDRSEGESKFQLRKWLPHYLKWFFYAFGKKTNVSRRNQEK